MKGKRRSLGGGIWFNIKVLIVFLVFAEFVAWCYAFYRMNFEYANSPHTSEYVKKAHAEKGMIFPRYQLFTQNYFDWFNPDKFRPVANPQKNDKLKPPIVVFGCSYAYGYKLEDHQTFSYKLANIMGRAVFNRAYIGWGIQHMLYMLENDLWLDGISDPEFVIFIFLESHLTRLFSFVGEDFTTHVGLLWPDTLYPTYENFEDGLKVKKYTPFLRSSFLLMQLADAYRQSLFKNGNFLTIYEHPWKVKKVVDFAKLHFLQSFKSIQRKWPNAKFVVLNYYSYRTEINTLWPGLEENGIAVYQIPELAGIDVDNEKWRLPNIAHPNEAAWDLITPVVAKKLEELSKQGARNGKQ